METTVWRRETPNLLPPSLIAPGDQLLPTPFHHEKMDQPIHQRYLVHGEDAFGSFQAMVLMLDIQERLMASCAPLSNVHATTGSTRAASRTGRGGKGHKTSEKQWFDEQCPRDMCYCIKLHIICRYRMKILLQFSHIYSIVYIYNIH